MFKVIDAKGNTVVANLTTDEDGFINSGILPPGEYAFVETQAPEGYVLDETPITFTVIEGQETPINLTAINKLKTPMIGSVTLKKVSKETNKTLTGAEFKLVTKDGTVIEENLVTDRNGQIHVTGLAPGDYQFVETKAPEGYVLDETPVTFSIIENDDTEIRVTKKNKLIPTETSTTGTSRSKIPSIITQTTTGSSQTSKGLFPKTGEKKGSMLFISLGISLIGVSFYLIKKK